MVLISVRCDGWDNLLRLLQEVHQETAEEKQGIRILLSQRRKETQRPVGNIAYAIVVDVVTVVFIPVVALHDVAVIALVRRHIKGITYKVVAHNGVVAATGDEAHTPPAVAYLIAFDEQVLTSVYHQAHGVAPEDVTLNTRILQFFDEQPEAACSLIVLEYILQHRYIVRVHHCHAGTIMAEDVVHISIVVGEHEVEAIALAAVDRVTGYIRMLTKFEVDAVAMMTYLVVGNSQSVAFPTMNTTSHRRVLRDIAFYLIMLHGAVACLLKHDGEHVVLENIVHDPHIAHVLREDTSIVEP